MYYTNGIIMNITKVVSRQIYNIICIALKSIYRRKYVCNKEFVNTNKNKSL